MRRRSGDVVPVKSDRALMRDEPGDGIDEGGFAGAVRPDEPDQLSGVHVEIDVDHRAHATERHGDVAGRQDVGHSAATTVPCNSARRVAAASAA